MLLYTTSGIINESGGDHMPLSEAKKKANRKWNDKNYERLNLSVPLGMNEKIDEAVKMQGYQSKRAFCIDAIMEKIESKKEE